MYLTQDLFKLGHLLIATKQLFQSLKAHNTGLQVVAEGVLEKEQFDMLVKNNCELIQGYFILHSKFLTEPTFST
ncbi:EAL domain-containing protein [Ureibacillus sp. MALMAid1270]|uniref:EAL domain-containing protein n=1 Tax=Ureibacillus sp. MALMAid1270 TaxID=3411629 RepID=UPI003BA80B9B